MDHHGIGAEARPMRKRPTSMGFSHKMGIFPEELAVDISPLKGELKSPKHSESGGECGPIFELGLEARHG